jgi:hypothetical protein
MFCGGTHKDPQRELCRSCVWFVPAYVSRPSILVESECREPALASWGALSRAGGSFERAAPLRHRRGWGAPVLIVER